MVDALLNGDEVDKRRRVRRRQILTAARALFVEQGYKKTTVTEVAKRAGVTKPTLYDYYQSKAQLMLHAIVYEKKLNLSAMQPAFDQSLPARRRLEELISVSLRLSVEMPLTNQVIQGDPEVLHALMSLDDVKPFVGTDAQGDALRTHVYEDLLREIAPKALSATDRRDRAKILVLLPFCGPTLKRQDLLQGLKFERLVKLLASMLAAGVDAK